MSTIPFSNSLDLASLLAYTIVVLAIAIVIVRGKEFPVSNDT